MTPDQKYIFDRIVVDPATRCWVWQKATRNAGYAMAARRVPGQKKFRTVAVHRMSYEVFIGEIPHGMLVRHRCDNPSCVNPEHLQLGTQEDNIDDMLRKNRQAWACALTEADVASARDIYANNFFTQAELADQFGVGVQAMFQALRGIKKGQNTIVKVVAMQAAGFKRRDIIAAMPHIHPDKLDYWLYREKRHRKHSSSPATPPVEDLVFADRVSFRAMLPLQTIAAELDATVEDVIRALALQY